MANCAVYNNNPDMIDPKFEINGTKLECISYKAKHEIQTEKHDFENYYYFSSLQIYQETKNNKIKNYYWEWNSEDGAKMMSSKMIEMKRPPKKLKEYIKAWVKEYLSIDIDSKTLMVDQRQKIKSPPNGDFQQNRLSL
jgi:hypothetical protein